MTMEFDGKDMVLIGIAIILGALASALFGFVLS
jgi:hypothetical protein